MFGRLSFAAFCSGSRMSSKSSSRKKKKNNGFDNWFGSRTVAELKILCKAAKLPVSGTKPQLCDRLMNVDAVCLIGVSTQPDLKQLCKDKLLIQSGNKFDQVLRLLHVEYGTGTAKRAATETIVDESTGEKVEVLKKKRKTTPSPKTIYTRVEKKIKAVSQKKYQSHWGSKDHSTDVYLLMYELIKTHVIYDKIVDSDPILALDMSKAVFQAFDDHFYVMVRPGYGTEFFGCAIDSFVDVVKAVRPRMSSDQVDTVVKLLESVDSTVSGYGLDGIENAILAVKPDYKPELN